MKDLTIRLLGRPKITKDSQAGFNTLVRRYVVQGPRASKVGIEDPTNPLFLAVGSIDEEFTDYKLVNQALDPGTSVDKAYLTRTFVDLRERWVVESVTQTTDLYKLNRKYVVLRGEDALHGYSASAFAKHPSNAATKDNGENPWDYAPNPVLNGEPTTRSMTYGSSGNSGLTYTPYVSIDGNSQPFSNYMASVSVAEAGLGSWIRGKASVQMSAPGIDIWDVEYVTHQEPYWTFGTTSQRGGTSSKTMTVVDFDHRGLKLTSAGGTSGSSSSTLVKTKTYNFFVVADELPQSVAKVAGGTGAVGGGVMPSVKLDVVVTGFEGGTASYTQFIRNGVWNINTDQYLEFPGSLGQNIRVGHKNPYSLQFDFEPWYVRGSDVMPIDGFPLFQGRPIAHIGGQITWTATQLSVYQNGTTQTIVSNAVATKISPLFNYGQQKIWKVQITYVG